MGCLPSVGIGVLRIMLRVLRVMMGMLRVFRILCILLRADLGLLLHLSLLLRRRRNLVGQLLLHRGRQVIGWGLWCSLVKARCSL
jgi:hypothetical protein